MVSTFYYCNANWGVVGLGGNGKRSNKMTKVKILTDGGYFSPKLKDAIGKVFDATITGSLATLESGVSFDGRGV